MEEWVACFVKNIASYPQKVQVASVLEENRCILKVWVAKIDFQKIAGQQEKMIRSLCALIGKRLGREVEVKLLPRD